LNIVTNNGGGVVGRAWDYLVNFAMSEKVSALLAITGPVVNKAVTWLNLAGVWNA
jgi:hypothetical protein